jgi:hypothetical protein
LGEYVILKLTDDSNLGDGPIASGLADYPAMDVCALPTRIDAIEPDYLGLVDPDSTGGLGEWLNEYSIEGMTFTVERARQNRGALGRYCKCD